MSPRSTFQFLRQVLAALLSISLISPAWAAPQWCQGSIGAAWVDWNGNLLVNPSWRGDHLLLCNVRTALTANGVTIEPVTCVSWLSLARQAITGNKQTVINYGDAPACAQIPTYGSSPLPAYFMVLN